MNGMGSGKEGLKEAMKRLRKERKEMIAAAAAKVKAQNKAVRAIMEQLREGPRTVPEIADASGIPTDQVLWYLASLKKYGKVLEGEKDGSYFRYQAAGAEEEQAAG